MLFSFAYYIYNYTGTCIHELLSMFGLHPFPEESLDFSTEHQEPRSLEAVNLSSVTVSTKVSLHVEAEKKIEMNSQ